MSDRGMKKWAPYRSLPEKDIHDVKMKRERNKIEKPLISNEKAEEINELLSNNVDTLIFTIFDNGKLIKYTGKIKSIDTIDLIVRLDNKDKIKIKNIIDIKIQ